MKTAPPCVCGSNQLQEAFVYSTPPEGEVRFPLQGAYKRAYHRCGACGHYVSRHEMDMSGLYAGAYVDATYGKRMQATFEKIISLPVEKSDNEGRARRVLEYAEEHLETPRPRILDVGSGLCVFLYRMQQEGWECLALDPDLRAAEHAEQAAGVAAVQADFTTDDDTLQKLGPFDVVTFNKVLEHVLDPVAMLGKAKELLASGGFVYVELPDAEAAAEDGKEREEFFIDHHHVFSMDSVKELAKVAGFLTQHVERLQEPSSKYTIRAFLTPAA